ncbi:hypothetical protein GCM10027615_06990 [Plantactinospora veratri]
MEYAAYHRTGGPAAGGRFGRGELHPAIVPEEMTRNAVNALTSAAGAPAIRRGTRWSGARLGQTG